MPSIVIALFLLAGFMFGLLTYSRRHLFVEGPKERSADSDGLDGRLFWVAVCTFLWPIQLVAGLHGLWRGYRLQRS